MNGAYVEMHDRSLFNLIGGDLRRSWKDLILADLAYKVIAFVVLTPIVGVIFRVMLATSGSSLLADQDILYFFLRPVGLICFAAVGALWLGIIAMEQATLLAIIGAASQQNRMRVVQALRFAAANSRPVVFVAARLLVFTLVAIAPFVVVAALTYRVLLGEFDINYYLTEKTWEFQVAVALGAISATSLVAVLLRLATGWFFALPLVLYEGVSPAMALRVSRESASRCRRILLMWIAGWVVGSIVVSALATSLVLILARLCVPHATGSLWLLMAAIGVTLILWAGASLTVNLLSTIGFAAMLFNLYRQLGGHEGIDLSRLNAGEAVLDENGSVLTTTKLLCLASASFVLAIIIGAFAVHSIRLDDRTTIMAHRGSSLSAPENTMAAIKQAIADGADWVEIDVQETADGEVVVLHDSDFMKLAGVNLKIWDANWTDLAEIDIGSRYDPKFKNERVPKLSDVLDECRGKVGVNIELKYYGHDEQLEQRVVDIVEAHGMVSEVVVMSLNSDAVKKMKLLRPNWKVGQLMSVSTGGLQNFDADFLAINANFADRSFIRAVQAAGKDVYVWTVNDASTMSTMVSRGVDGLITDNPALARSVLRWRSRLSPVERLVLQLAGILGVVPEIRDL
jgi:glycerophosphoryl diester phosphodiesterase